MGTQEGKRLTDDKNKEKDWKLWGPYLSERQWATVREDYSKTSSSWDYFTHEQSRFRAYRWGEDGLLGFTDRRCRLCLAVALWNGKDRILKERLFGLTNGQGNHGEDCKECYYYLDSTPTHSFMKALYKYPQSEYPYEELVAENASRSNKEPEFELKDTGAFKESRYWDVLAEYCKNDDNDILCRYTLTNRGPEASTIHFLPTLWFRNTWTWGCAHEGTETKPKIESSTNGCTLITRHESLPDFTFHFGSAPDGTSPQILFTENETDTAAVLAAEKAAAEAERLAAEKRTAASSEDAEEGTASPAGTSAAEPQLSAVSVAHDSSSIAAGAATVPAAAGNIEADTEKLFTSAAESVSSDAEPTVLLSSHTERRAASAEDSASDSRAWATSAEDRASDSRAWAASAEDGASDSRAWATSAEDTASDSRAWAASAEDGASDSRAWAASQDNMADPADDEVHYFKDAFHKYIINGEVSAVSPQLHGTKACGLYTVTVAAGESFQIKCRLQQSSMHVAQDGVFGCSFDEIFSKRVEEADEFYDSVIVNQGREDYNISRQAYAGLLWSKQFYFYIVKDWLVGDARLPKPPKERLLGRNKDWLHLYNCNILSMPDKWEYPWYAAWDTAFHMVPMASIDIEFAKKQLVYFLRESYMHPNGQIPAYEFAFSDVNPPVHAWAVLKVHKKTGPRGSRDDVFLARCFHKLIVNFTWWVNRKDPLGRNIFAGGFLGLDNIGLFDRSKPLPNGHHLEQADGTAWMAFYCYVMLDIALELADTDAAYEDVATKFLEHFVLIADALNMSIEQAASAGLGQLAGLWDEDDGFYYDQVMLEDGTVQPIKLRSLVGLVPLFTSLTLKEKRIKHMKGFYKRTKWLRKHREGTVNAASFLTRRDDDGESILLALPMEEKFVRIMKRVLDENEFLSPYGIRSLSKYYAQHPYVLELCGEAYSVAYSPAESTNTLFGGNSNWRGPIWICMNYLLIESLQRYYYFYGDSLKLECPTGSGVYMTLKEVSNELARRVAKLFIPGSNGQRPCHGNSEEYAKDPVWRDLVLFYEYFDGDTGRGLGASHQTGWTALVTDCLQQISKA